MASVKAGDQTVSSASRVFNVPRKTISNRLGLHDKQVHKSGGCTVFSEEHEDQIVVRLRYLESHGFPMNVDTLLKCAYVFANDLHRRKLLNSDIPKNWHQNKKCSRDWWW